MARRTRTRSTTTTRSSSKRNGSGIGKYLVAAAGVGVAAYLLWPKTAHAAQQQPTPTPTPGPFNPPAPAPGPSGLQLEPVADAPLTAGSSRGRVLGDVVNVRQAANDTAAVVARIPRGAGVAYLHVRNPATPNAPNGWRKVRTSRGTEGYVAAQLLQIDDEPIAANTSGLLSQAEVNTADFFRRHGRALHFPYRN